MKKLLGTVTIYEDDTFDQSNGSSSSEHEKGTKEWVITLRPNVDRAVAPKVRPTGPDVLAHELGHMIGSLFGTRDAKVSGFAYSTPEDNLRGEKEAWYFALQMRPGLDKKVMKDALSAYEYGVRTYPGVPMGLLRMLNIVT